MEKIKQVSIVDAGMLHAENGLLGVPIGERFQEPQGGLDACDSVGRTGLQYYFLAVVNSPIQAGRPVPSL